ncbi:flagellar basal-body MS-ring/collar protein FliF [Bacillus sp. FJAT-18017]|uniref:flagellar basal-body MS-ring/collar protein FliF n=1 Tax=Bacillus sp. FJAT-18017 TaxID=1705566 RepID=UPI0006B04A09|nr:flagellar basal-body MS-ring/collar protein FliF [Bacillus sp. FJAT-18017]
MRGSWKDQIKKSTELFSQYWGARSSKQKWLIIGTFLFLMFALSAFVVFASRPQYVPLYTGQLSTREVGDIKAELDSQGYTDYKLSDNGTMLLVPQKDAADLLVTLASAGYPKDTNINYDIFSQNLSFGATDRQFDILEREAMQNQLAKVITHIDGIKNAEVILNLPEESVFIRPGDEQAASASVMVEIEPGAKLNNEQVKALYTLIARSVKNLPMENITVMNQYSETLLLDETGTEGMALENYDEQRKVQQDIERDIQQNLQKLLGGVLGSDKVSVHTFVKMNFDKVKTQENLVKPADGSEQGLVISSEESSKSYTGTDAENAGGVVGTGETDVPGYTGNTANGTGDYEEAQERVNYEVNRITNEIVKSPYEIEDISINVGVPSIPGKPGLVPEGVQENVHNVAANIVRTALGHPELTVEQIAQRVTVVPHQFSEETPVAAEAEQNWFLIGGIAVAAATLLLIGLLIWMFVRRSKKEDEEIQAAFEQQQPIPLNEQEYFAEHDLTVESQLKRLLEQRPEDFAKIVRTWLHEEEV